MYAVVRLAGKQCMVSPEGKIKVPRLDVEEGSLIQCDQVLFYSQGDDTRIGNPTLDDVKVTAEVVSHGRDKKVTVFKMKRRKNYRRRKGHRQEHTILKIKEISV
jgi:large subunit ribosomal protein L21